MADVINLPTAPISFYTVAKGRKAWAVFLVTPVTGMKPIKTALYWSPERDLAVMFGKETAARMQRPFKEGRAV